MSAIEQALIGVITLAITLTAILWVKRESGRFRKLIAVTTAMTLC